MQQVDELKDDDIPSCQLEAFVEFDEVMTHINELKNIYDKTLEKSYEKFSEIISRYLEQPHLLDPNLQQLTEALLGLIQNKTSPDGLIHAAFMYMYQICKVRTFKVFVKFLPHELSDIDFVLNLLEKQKGDSLENWHTRYMLLLWMSILVLNPFHFSRLDAHDNTGKEVSKMERTYRICTDNCRRFYSWSTVAGYMAAKFLVRNEIKEIYLSQFFDWCMEQVKNEDDHNNCGPLIAIAAVLKHGKREDLLPYAAKLLKWVLEQNFEKSSDFLKNKFYIKIVQRLGLIFLPPKIAQWRYNRGSRSLQTNLQTNKNESVEILEFESTKISAEEVDDIDVPDEIEDVIEQLLHGLKSSSGEVRWLSAKGIGRVTNRLPKALGDEVVGSVIEILNPLEQHEAWHGACLGVAELAKRGLLLPYRLEHLVPLLLRALVYDEMKGYMSVGQNIRDSACYVCWAFARAYNPQDLQPFVQRIATGLLIVTVFDREINCRRAASAAFQESVGRLGNFPHGIDILTAADFYTVGLRSNSFLVISDFIAKHEEYTTPLIDHLLDLKVGHWDITVRELTAKALSKLTHHNPRHLTDHVLPKLFENTSSIDVNLRHGSVMAIGEILLALKDIDKTLITPSIIEHLNNLVLQFHTREQFRGMSGELMRMASLDMIRNCSIAELDVTKECVESWQVLIDSCIISKSSRIRELAIIALGNFCKCYYEHSENNQKIVTNYLNGSDNDLEEFIRSGYVLAVGVLPHFMLEKSLDDVLDKLINNSLVPLESQVRAAGLNLIILNWSESRRDSVKALGNVVSTVGIQNLTDEQLKKIFECLLKALEEYTTDNRGDVGAWVREASMHVLHYLMVNCPSDRLNQELVHEVLSGLTKQSVEKIDRIRAVAGKLFHNLIHHQPPLPHIQKHQEIMEIIPSDSNSISWLFADHTFPIFCKMLMYPEYSEKILTGLVGSIGQLTESLIKHSSSSFLDFLKANDSEIPRICELIVKIFEENLLNERISHPMLNFLEMLLSSGVLVMILDDENNKFADEILRLTNLEIRGYKKLYKVVSSINVYCQLIQVPRLAPKIFSKMGIFLGITHVHIRKSAALKFYEAMLLYGDTTDVPESNLDEVSNLLMDFDWTQALTEVRPVRNQLCELLGVKSPVSQA